MQAISIDIIMDNTIDESMLCELYKNQSPYISVSGKIEIACGVDVHNKFIVATIHSSDGLKLQADSIQTWKSF